MRILVISPYFPPTNAIGALRVGKFVRFLTDAGHDVHVISAVQRTIAADLEAKVGNAIVHEIPWIDINNLLTSTMRREYDFYRKGVGRLGPVVSRVANLWRTILNFPDNHSTWCRPAMKAARSLVSAWRPDLIFASASPVSSLIVAHRLSQETNIPWVAELRDLWVDNHYYNFPAWRRFLETWLEKRVLSSAALRVTVSAPLARILEDKFAKPAMVVTNGFDLSDYPQGVHPPEAPTLTIRHMGMIYPGRRDPRPLFAALKLLGPLATRVKIEFMGRSLPGLRALIDELGVGDHVSILPPVSHEESLRLQCESDVLLLLLWNTPQEKGVFTGKLFEYIGARRPVLCLGLEDGVAPNLIRERGLGAVAVEPEAIANCLRAWIEQKDRGAIPPIDDRALAGLSRNEQNVALLGRLETIVNETRKALPPRICHIITSLGSGGAERVASRLVTALPKDEVDQSIISLMDEGFHGAPLRQQGIRVTTLGMSSERLSLGPWVKLVKHLRTERPDVVMTWLYHADFVGTVAALLAQTPKLVWNIRCSNMDLSPYSWRTGLVRRCLALISGLPCTVIANSQAGIDHHRSVGYHPRQWIKIANGFDCDECHPDAHDRDAVRRELGLSDDDILIGMVARVDPMKNHDGFIEAASRASRAAPHLKFVLIGRNTNQKGGEVEKLVQANALDSKVTLLGERPDVPRLLRGLDVLVSASLFGEGLSNAVGEAMASGVPCIVTDVGDSAHLIGPSGLVVPPADTEALAQAMSIMACKSREDRVAMGMAARSRIMEQFSLEVMVNSYRELLKAAALRGSC